MKLATFFFATAAVVLAQDTVSATGAACEPHEDHWHCPAGVPEPTTPPAAQVTGSQSSASPSATGSVVVSTTKSEAAATACEPHNDHWHCPSGVPEPTTPPAATATGADHDHEDEHDHDHDHEEDDDHDHDHDHAVTATTCEPHNDHWHCPSGVAEPTTPPAVSTTATSSGTAAAASNEPSTSQSAGAAAKTAGAMDSLPIAAAGLLGLLFA
ncbi:hypothetical protein GRF29_1g2228109 [Pseudopithomyces chartarum]|uniref:Uncharacterized protein n=1 Tax=Pseudopithomyces chartarum TaxID=1892770 RepID=A0AAN6M7E1_9PLEO|nr:hypothetical protein GRF29_1g2228109 [Pseudopithomyces chartarum]